ncbi:MAG: peptidoglycan editing factor PgeF [Deltaproteobacteria bacterium]|nr:peptidoglycan editing factor PgeF [Deltaproteobacteria bacterium]
MEMNRLEVPQWQNYPGLLHGFMGRRGGKSVGRYAGLNVSYRVGDDNKIVSQNVCDMKLAVGIHDGKVVTMQQVHGDNILEITDKKMKEAGEADGMVTAENGVYLGVLTADCVPILFIAPKQKLVAAVHAGWRGTLAGIAEKAVRLFQDRHNVDASELEVALGPSIGVCCYEVNDDVAQPLMKKWGSLTTPSIAVKDGKPHINLSRLNRDILREAGVPGKQLFQVGPCTRCAAEDFYSYRGAGGETGRQIGVVGWLPA